MGTIDRFTAEQYITQIFFDYLNALKKAKRNKKKLIPETNVLFEGMDDFKTFIKSPDLQLRVYNRLNLEGLKELFNGCCILAKEYELESYKLVKDCDIIDNEHYFKLNSVVSSFSAGGTYKFNLECMSDTQKKWYQYYGKSWYCYKLNPNTNKYEEYKEGLGEYRGLCDTNTNDRAFLFKEPGQYKITASVFQNSINPFDGVFGKLQEVETIEITVIDDADPAIVNLGLKEKYIRAIQYADLGTAFASLGMDIAGIALTIIAFVGIGFILKKVPAGKLKPFLTKVAKKIALPELLTFFGTVGDAFDVAAFIGAICSFDEQVKNAKNEEHLKLAGKTWEKVVETFGLLAVMTFMNILGNKMKKAEVENEIKAIDDVPAKTVDTTDTLSQKYLDNLNEKSIKKLSRREDRYEILKKYEEYFGDNVEFVNELIENTPGKEIYVEPEKLILNYLSKNKINVDSINIKQIINKNTNFDELKKTIDLINSNVKDIDPSLLKSVPLETAVNKQTGYMKELNTILEKKGMTLERYKEIVLRNIDDTSNLPPEGSEELQQLAETIRSIREEVIGKMDSDVEFRKYITQQDLIKYLNGEYNTIGGYFSRNCDSRVLTEYNEIFNSVRLDYPNTAYNPEKDKFIAYITFRLKGSDDLTKIEIPYSELFGGKLSDSPPVSGTAILNSKNGLLIPEFKATERLELIDGAELHIICRDKNNTDIIVGKYKERKYKKFIQKGDMIK